MLSFKECLIQNPAQNNNLHSSKVQIGCTVKDPNEHNRLFNLYLLTKLLPPVPDSCFFITAIVKTGTCGLLF